MCGCWALGVLAGDDNNRAKIGAAGGIKLVITAMKNHGKYAPVQEHGCRTLRHLAAKIDVRAKIRAEGGIEVVKAAMEKLRNSSDVQTTAKNKSCARGLVEARNGHGSGSWARGILSRCSTGSFQLDARSRFKKDYKGNCDPARCKPALGKSGDV
eukprot:1854058-Rhodomonas_salina.1